MSTGPDTEAVLRNPPRSRSWPVVIGSVASAGAGYVVLLTSSRLLTPGDNAVFLAFWGFLFFWFGLLNGVTLETTRSVHARPGTLASGARSRVLPLAGVLGAVLAIGLALAGPIWTRLVLTPDSGGLWPAACLAVFAWAGMTATVGILGGGERWALQSVVMTADGLGRIAIVLVAHVLVAGVAGFVLGVCVSSLTWLAVVLLVPGVRRSIGARIQESARRYLTGSALAASAAAASAALLVGFPVLLRATTPSTQFAGAAPLVLAISLTRAPLLVPITAYQGVVIAYYLRSRSRGPVVLLPVIGGVAAVGVLGAVAAWIVGPWLIEALVDPRYHVPGAVLAALTFAAALLAILSLVGAAVLASGRHLSYAAGWVVATVLAVVLLAVVPGDPQLRSVVALAAAPLAGTAVHAAALRGDRVGEAQRAGRPQRTPSL